MTVLAIQLCTCLLAAEPMPASEPRPMALPLFAGVEWYQKASEEEKPYEGTIELNPASGQIGKPTRFNSYRLTWTLRDGTRVVRELYAPGKAQYLALYVGKRVRIVGKAVDTKADGKMYAELWPARLEPGGLISPDMQDGILARCIWQPAAARKRGTTEWVITGGAELARHCGYFGDDVDKRATQDLAAGLKVPAVDWSKQMLVCVAAGLHGSGERVRITRITLKDKIMTVSYKLEHPADAVSGICYPAETALVDRFDGEVKFEADKSAK